ncbi:unnamed protein product [Bursaphelenchus okinawaensis]|uniref:Uncharacterized protein n=1 Tax=Bursaphelenchus okinawaensis TaxID=465554 RepID=A0A811KKG6_9BILA|nr:unnamed protein product [Bursaphelenchus okinawaensis]CAG9104370.1 unnamed protein product [Bursaphelenchus okinawaensis]
MSEYGYSVQRCRSYSLSRTFSRPSSPGRLCRTVSSPSLVPSFTPQYESYLSRQDPVRRYQRDRSLDYTRAYNRYKYCTPYQGGYYPRYYLNTDYIGTHSYYWGNLNAYYPQYRSHVNDYGSNKYIAGFYSNYHQPLYDRSYYSTYSKPYYHSSYKSYFSTLYGY